MGTPTQKRTKSSPSVMNADASPKSVMAEPNLSALISDAMYGNAATTSQPHHRMVSRSIISIYVDLAEGSPQ